MRRLVRAFLAVVLALATGCGGPVASERKVVGTGAPLLSAEPLVPGTSPGGPPLTEQLLGVPLLGGARADPGSLRGSAGHWYVEATLPLDPVAAASLYATRLGREPAAVRDASRTVRYTFVMPVDGGGRTSLVIKPGPVFATSRLCFTRSPTPRRNP